MNRSIDPYLLMKRSRRTILCATAVLFAFLLLLVAGSPHAANSRVGSHAANTSDPPQQPPPPRCCNPDEDEHKPHLLAASYYSLKNGQRSKLLLNNKGPRPLEVKPTLFSMSGERYDIEPVKVEGASFQMINLRRWVKDAGPQFREGSIKVFHLGKDLVLGAQVYVEDEAQSLSFEEKFAEPATMASSKLRGVWWLPSQKGEVRLALSNTSDSAVMVMARADGARPARAGSVTVELLPHETRVLDVQRDFFGRSREMSRLGGISVEHNGLAGAVLARGFAQEAAKGYSLAVQFSDPQASKSSGYQGAGLRLDASGGEALTQVAVAHNAGVAEAVVTGRLPYTTADGLTALVTLPEVRLAPGETEAIDIAGAIKDAGIPPDVTGAGLEFEYSAAPGSVQMAALSVGGNGDQVFRLPLWDVAAQRSATGGYPWFIDGSSSTVVYLKNVTSERQEYTLRLGFEGGEYLVGVKSIEPRQILTFDIRELRDKQVPDDNGVTIPLTAERGQIIWSVYGPDGLAMIGRSEQADVAKGVSNNYACVSCCPDSYVSAKVEPETASVGVSGTVTYVAKEQRSTCNGQPAGWYTVGAAWSSLNTSVATVSSGGVATGVAAGTASIRATWTATSRFPIMGSCGSTQFTVNPTVPLNVVQVKVKLADGTDITNTTRDVIVGQKISLTVEVLPSGTSFTSPQWTIPGNRIANYAVTCTGSGTPPECQAPTSAAVTALTNPTDAAVDYYWVDGADGRQVQYSITVSGSNITGQATFNVKRPTAQVTATTGTVAVGSPFGNLELHYGTTSIPGISFSRTITVPTGFAGATQWVQTVTTLRRRQLNSGAWERWSGTGLDTTYPYDSGSSTSDSPGNPLSSDYLQVTADDSFTMWLMFKPDGATSIWVPLRQVSWSWAGAASRSGSTWTLNSSSNTGNPADADSTTHPTWTLNVANNSWVAE